MLNVPFSSDALKQELKQVLWHRLNKILIILDYNLVKSQNFLLLCERLSKGRNKRRLKDVLILFCTPAFVFDNNLVLVMDKASKVFYWILPREHTWPGHCFSSRCDFWSMFQITSIHSPSRNVTSCHLFAKDTGPPPEPDFLILVWSAQTMCGKVFVTFYEKRFSL